ncbi:helix-turn-helix transcriptional regulator [Niabella sp. CJ426]|uniref:helix-turn-helix transcriptional regulator n=1 Tax=Niabella sp. CJ426 TaxID=3393740 RepID=UPI003CFFDCFB
MNNGEIPGYTQFISTRLEELMKLAGLTVAGLARFINISEPYMHSLINGNRQLTAELANRAGSLFNIDGANILRPAYRLPKSAKKSKYLSNFYDENKNVTSYFSTHYEQKPAFYIENELYHTDIFDSPIYIWELRDHCVANNKKYSSKQLSQILNYMVDRGLLKKKKRSIKLKNGSYGKRKVDVFFKPNLKLMKFTGGKI